MFVAYILTLGLCAASVSCQKTVGEPWPLPQSLIHQTKFTFSLDADTFRFYTIGQTCDILEQALDRYYRIIFFPDESVNKAAHEKSFNMDPWGGRPGGKVNTVLKFHGRTNTAMERFDINLQTPCETWPSFEMDETYDLNVGVGSDSDSILTAKSVWGILRGLETFSQLVYETGTGEKVVNSTTIHDFPRFAHRGTMLDTSRHFLPKEVIMQNLDAMAYNKLNVFHWHIVDSQSFPYQSSEFPDLSYKGAYNPYTHVYSQADILEVVEYARLRGIRVIPEFDSPGHTLSWGKGQPDLLTPCYSKGKPSGDFGPVDPSKNTTYQFLSGFMKEITGVFPDKYVHLGGDEVPYDCWQSNPDIQAFMKSMNFGSDYSKLEQYYMQHLLDIVGSYHSEYIIWQEVIDNGCKVRPDTVVDVWKYRTQNEEMAKVTSLGYHTILSACWYLNKITMGTDWHAFYACDPHSFNGTEQQKNLVIGGEMCMWGEWVDATNLISRLWPRGSAVAERLWSAESVKDPAAATARMEEHRCRMVRRGLNAEPVNGPSFCDHEYKPRL